MSPRSAVSVNAWRQDIGFAPFNKPPPSFHRYPSARRVLSDLPVQGTYHPAIDNNRPPTHSYGWQPLHFVHDSTNCAANQHTSLQRTPQSAGMELMLFDDYFIDNSENMLDTSKQSNVFPMCQQATPQNFSFRPWPLDTHHQTTSLRRDSLIPMKVESNPDVANLTLPTPAVLSTEVDVSKYEAVQHRDWLEAYPDYMGLSSASPATLDSSPRSEDIDSFAVQTTHNAFKDWSIGPHNGTQLSRYHSMVSSYTDDGTSASPAVSYDDFNQATTLPWSASMFGFPEVVPPSRFPSSSRPHQPATAAPKEIERPPSQNSDRVISFVPTLQARHMAEEDDGYVKRRDKLLIDLRRKGHSYKEIKRLGHFKEAESTLRGRLRTLTKDKSERVRRPKWNRRDIELLQDGVERFVAESSGSSRRPNPSRKLPWKKISEWMKKQGSSYLFAPATCAKKWEEI